MKLKMAEAARRRPRKLLPHLVGETARPIRPESGCVKGGIRTHGGLFIARDSFRSKPPITMNLTESIVEEAALEWEKEHPTSNAKHRTSK
jgi:hypothetical protein